jgi:hypothetical protein
MPARWIDIWPRVCEIYSHVYVDAFANACIKNLTKYTRKESTVLERILSVKTGKNRILRADYWITINILLS